MNNRRLPILRISCPEFRRRQRDEFLRQPVWRICFKRVQDFAVQYKSVPWHPTPQQSRQQSRAPQ